METAIPFGGTVLAEIALLLDLQATDIQLQEFSIQIERLLAQREQTEGRIAGEELAVNRLRERLSELEHESRMKNLEVDELDMNIRQYQERLDKGIISFKEMEDLRAKIESERGRISSMEDDALVLMDTIEESKRTLEHAVTDCTANVERLRSQIDDISSWIIETQAKADTLTEERAAICEQIPAYLIKQYDTLHQRSSGPIAPIKSGTCSGCKLKLSGSTVERVRGGMGIVTCEHCSRILYVAEYESGA